MVLRPTDRNNERHVSPRRSPPARLRWRPLLARGAGGSPGTPRLPAKAARSKAWRALDQVKMGLSKEEIIEVIIQTAPYSGFPKALNALAMASRILS